MKSVFKLSFLLLFIFLSLSLAEVSLSILYVRDPSLKGLTPEEINLMIEEARLMMLKKFGVKDIKFINKKEMTVKDFFNSFLSLNEEMESRYIPYTSLNWKPYESEILSFIKQWKIWDLEKFFPEKKGTLKTYEQIVPELMSVYEKRLKRLEEIKYENGTSLIPKDDLTCSYLAWKNAMFSQDICDVVISDSLIVYDDIKHPYPHAVTRFAKVGGGSFESPKRPDFCGFSAMVNLFETMTELTEFRSPRLSRPFTLEERAKILGGYILAHELGHMIYLIPDVYDHEKGCLMDSSAETLDYFQGYQELIKYDHPCSVCQAWVIPRNYHFEGDRKFKEKDYAGAAEDYKMCIKLTPKDLDVDYNSYISSVCVKAGRAYLNSNNKEKAKFYLLKAIQHNPENKDAQKFLEELK